MLDFKDKIKEMQEEMHAEFIKNNGKVAVINGNRSLSYKVCTWEPEGEDEDAYVSVTLTKFGYDKNSGFTYDIREEMDLFDLTSEVNQISTIEFVDEFEILDGYVTRKLFSLNAEILRSCENFESTYPVKLTEMPLSMETLTAVYLGECEKPIEKRALNVLYKKHKNEDAIYELEEISSYAVSRLISELSLKYEEKTTLCKHFIIEKMKLEESKQKIEPNNMPF